jgi:hypothetical protein
MREVLPFALGFVAGGAVARLRGRARVVLLAVACLSLGALASAINGELTGRFWAVFVSFDALLVWLGAAVSTGLVWSYRQLRGAG